MLFSEVDRKVVDVDISSSPIATTSWWKAVLSVLECHTCFGEAVGLKQKKLSLRILNYSFYAQVLQ